MSIIRDCENRKNSELQEYQETIKQEKENFVK